MNGLNKVRFLAFAALLCAVLGGCDVDSADQRILITPSDVTLAPQQSVEFVASGGYEYTWSLSRPQWGSLSTTVGDRTIYTSLVSIDAGLDNIQVLTATSRLTETSGGGTNAASYIETADAYIRHR